jgi:hypothetical protein
VKVSVRRPAVFSSPAVVFASGAILADLAVVVLPWDFGSSRLTLAIASGFPVEIKIANLVAVFSGIVGILVGLAFVRRGRMAIASGVFVGLSVILGLRVLASMLSAIRGWVWQTLAVLALQTAECALLLLAARAAGQGRSASDPAAF